MRGLCPRVCSHVLYEMFPTDYVIVGKASHIGECFLCSDIFKFSLEFNFTNAEKGNATQFEINNKSYQSI